MARRVVESPQTGETFTFDDDWNEPDGRVRKLEYVIKPGAKVPLHSHPRTAQSFEVVSGELHIAVAGVTQVLKPGSRAATPSGARHTQWNVGSVPVVAIEGYDPPLAIEPFFTGLPRALASKNPLKIAVFFADYRSVSPPGAFGLKLFIGVFAPLGRLFGLGGWHRAP